VVRILEPRPKTASGSPVKEAGGFRLVSGTEEPEVVGKAAPKEDSPVVAAKYTSQANYGHAADYAWLRGRLEHSQVDGQWKLRYIPIGGTTDEYGGSVVLSDPAMLSGCERGDFIEVRGKMRKADLTKGRSPIYDIAGVERFHPTGE